MFNKKFSERIFSFHIYSKRGIAITTDTFLCVFTLWLAFYLRLEQFIKFNKVTILAVLISIFLSIPLFWLSGLYKAMFRYAGSSIFLIVSIKRFIRALTSSLGLFQFSVENA